MNDSQKWLEAAAGIEQDVQYLKGSLAEHELAALQIALGVYLKNETTVCSGIRPDYKIAY